MLPANRLLRVAAAVGLAASLGFAAAPALADDFDTAADCLAADNVWVVVEADDDVFEGCATEFATGLEALTSAGFDYSAAGGFVSEIEGLPVEPGEQDWWSYWHAEPTTGGTVGGWESYMVGAASSEPEPGTIEGWRLWHSFDFETAPAEPPSFPIITSEPADQTVDKGAPVTLTANVTSTPTPDEVQWYRLDGDEWVEIEGATALTLSLPAVQETTTFALLVANENGESESRPVTVTVREPEINPTPSPSPSPSPSVTAPAKPGLPSTGV